MNDLIYNYQAKTQKLIRKKKKAVEDLSSLNCDMHRAAAKLRRCNLLQFCLFYIELCVKKYWFKHAIRENESIISTVEEQLKDEQEILIKSHFEKSMLENTAESRTVEKLNLEHQDILEVLSSLETLKIAFDNTLSEYKSPQFNIDVFITKLSHLASRAQCHTDIINQIGNCQGVNYLQPTFDLRLEKLTEELKKLSQLSAKELVLGFKLFIEQIESLRHEVEIDFKEICVKESVHQQEINNILDNKKSKIIPSLLDSGVSLNVEYATKIIEDL